MISELVNCMDLSKADQVWNRAAMESGGDGPFEGDRALADLLLFHGMVMNGGFGHAFEVLSGREVSAAIDGFKFFGFFEIAQFLERIRTLSEEEQERMSTEYELASDAQLIDSFNAVLRKSPEDFAQI